MGILWKLDKAFVKEILAEYPEPKPAYNTISTIVRILQTKGFVDHESFGKSHRYFPLVTQKEYSSFSLNGIMQRHFSGSATSLLSFFVEEENVDVKELENLLDQLKKSEKKKS